MIGPDRPGIVARIAAVLAEAGCNLEDVATTILSGHFSMVMVCSVPTGTGAEVRRRLEAAARPDLLVAAWEVDELTGRPEPGLVLTVYGPDRVGIVKDVSGLLSRLAVNITDMTCRLQGDGVYVVAMELEGGPEAAALEAELNALLGPAGLDHSLRRIETEVL